MAMDHPAIGPLKAKFPETKFQGAEFRGQLQVIVPDDKLLDVVRFIKNDAALQYDMLADVTCVDYLNYPGWKLPRFGMVYIFNSVKAESPRLTLRVFFDNPDMELPSLVPLYAGAEWLEREVYDMFGIQFVGHPDLRRILTWDGFKPHPLRKDYPVTGMGERENYPVINRESA